MGLVGRGSWLEMTGRQSSAVKIQPVGRSPCRTLSVELYRMSM